MQREITRLEVVATTNEAAIEEEVVAVFLLAGDADNKEGSGFRRATGSGEEEEVGAAGSGEGWLRLLVTVGQGYDRGGCRGKKMRRAQLEATAAAREDGCSLRLRLHDGEEEWVTVMRLRARRQQWQGKRRRQRGSGEGYDSRPQLRVVGSGDAAVRERAAAAYLRWSRGRRSSDGKDGRGEGWQQWRHCQQRWKLERGSDYGRRWLQLRGRGWAALDPIVGSGGGGDAGEGRENNRQRHKYAAAAGSRGGAAVRWCRRSGRQQRALRHGCVPARKLLQAGASVMGLVDVAASREDFRPTWESMRPVATYGSLDDAT
ncbi:hypothetical protein GW17_00053467 [Ensete ventricosum]|nr:hypothetical protein GW17_00053467 [Ensete ventricosum]